MSVAMRGDGWYIRFQDDEDEDNTAEGDTIGGDNVEEEVELCEDQGGELHCDKEGITTHDPILPETAEIIYGGIASLLIFALLYKFAWPQIKKGMHARTARIQAQIDESNKASSDAAAESVRIRQAKGDINAERERLLAEADQQAALVLEEGRARLRQELVDNEARGQADIAAARSRAGAELRAEIARLSSAAIDQVVHGSLDGATHQVLIEAFISRVGASQPTGASQ
jgi:F-type H+-transporting ATPase subunit b